MRDRLIVTACSTLLLLLLAGAAPARAEAQALSANKIEHLLNEGVTPARLTVLVGRLGVAFELTGAVRSRLERAGADAGLIAAIERASAARAPAAAPAPVPIEEPAAAPPPAAASGEQRMVAVGGGAFFMGCNESVDTECDDDEKPGRTVDVPAFRIDRTEVTIEEYRRCVSAGRCSAPREGEYCNWGKSGRDHHPVNCVSWDQALALCEWRGMRLPTEAEWEKAARGTDRRKYPWGNAGYGAGGRMANIADESAKRQFSNWTIATGYDDGYVETAPVGTYPSGASPYGALDMIGNVWEWTADWYPGKVGEARVVRGGSWLSAYRGYARASFRSRREPGTRSGRIGFRCAR